MQDLEEYFSTFRNNIIGIDQRISTPYDDSIPLVYADWIASGRNYTPIEERIQKFVMPLVANTHTDTNATGMAMTYAYHKSQQIIKEHVNADETDVLISSGAGMTGVVNKFQRILGLRIHEKYANQIPFESNQRPVVFITHMEHHSNQTSWIETIADVEIIRQTAEGLVDLDYFETLLILYKDREQKYAAVTSCSNVTGIFTPYHEIAKIIHRHGGHCFVDFACSAPYVTINMHPPEEGAYLDAIYFSPHKFLGGPGASGILVFNKSLYHNQIPDAPGGGTVEWTNPWGEHKYVDEIEAREDGGTPAFLQTIKVAFCIQLKNEMGVDKILAREKQLFKILWERLSGIDNLHLLAPNQSDRLGIISFYIDNLHYNIGVKMLNDRFGIQTRGGCSCAGTYGHYLLNVQPEQSKKITDLINHGDYSEKPGWVRVSIHPTLTNKEVIYIGDSIAEMASKFNEWSTDYNLDSHSCVSVKSSLNDSFINHHIKRLFEEGF